MASNKFYGAVGYAEENVEVTPGVYRDRMVARKYYGDILRNSRQYRESDKVNDDLTVSNSISIVADAYAYEHFFAIKYAEWAGTFWDVDDVSVEGPRLILRLGGVYSGPKPAPQTP